jgi:hypothetical protein
VTGEGKARAGRRRQHGWLWLGLLGVILLGLACAETSPADLAKLPLKGEIKGGQKWRLEAGKPSAGDDVPSSWCFRLRYTKDIVLDGDPYVGGVQTCGMRPAPRVSGVVAVDCARHSVFVFGGARSGVRSVTLHARRGPVVKAQKATLPPNSRFKGYTFLLVGDTRRLPARLEADGAGQRVLARLPGRSSLCKPYPGAPEGGEPWAEFRSRN